MIPFALESPNQRPNVAERASVPGRLALAGFFLLFPAFLAYHYGVSAGWWSPVFGGLFGSAVILIVLASFSTLVEAGSTRRPISALLLMVLITLIHMIAWSLLGWMDVHHTALAGPIMGESAATVLTWLAVVFVGAMLPCQPALLRGMSIAGIIMVAICFVDAVAKAGFPAGPYLAFSGSDENGVATYQGIGRSLLAVALVAAFAVRPWSATSLAVLWVAAALLLSVGSRAHLFALLASILIHLTALLVRRKTRWLGIVGWGIAVAAVAAAASIFLETRASEILDLASSASWEERGIATASALQVISEHPVVGRFGYHILEDASYAHNALSAWPQYGLFGFVAFCVTMTSSLYIALLGLLRTRGTDPSWYLAAHANLIAVILAIASEPVMSSVFPALAWGLTLRAQSMHRTSRAASGG